VNIQLSIDYAIKVLQYLQENKEHTHTGHEISKATGISYHRFVLVASQLKKHGLLDSVRGKGGGHFLAKPIEEISLLNIYMAVQEDVQTNRCFNKKRHCTINDIGSCHKRGFICSLQTSLFADESIWELSDDRDDSNTGTRRIWGKELETMEEGEKE